MVKIVTKTRLYKLDLTLITPLVQLVERRFPKPDAVGSSPTGCVNLK